MSMVLARRPPTITCRFPLAEPDCAPNRWLRRLQPVNTIPALAATSLMNSLRLVTSPSRGSVSCGSIFQSRKDRNLNWRSYAHNRNQSCCYTLRDGGGGAAGGGIFGSGCQNVFFLGGRGGAP